MIDPIAHARSGKYEAACDNRPRAFTRIMIEQDGSNKTMERGMRIEQGSSRARTYFVSGQPLSFAAGKALSPRTVASCL
jgi:hypothetical protein